MVADAIQVRLVLDAQDGDEERTEEDLHYLLDELDQVDAGVSSESRQGRPRQVQGAPGWMRPGRC